MGGCKRPFVIVRGCQVSEMRLLSSKLGGLMVEFFRSLATLRFWTSFFENAKWLVVLSYLGHLSDSDNHLGFWLVVLIFGFTPVVDCCRYWGKKE